MNTMYKIIIYFLSILIFIFILLTLIYYTFLFIKNFVIGFFLNITITKDEKNAIEKQISELYKKSSFFNDTNKSNWFNRLIKNEKSKKIEHLVDVKNFYEKSMDIFLADYKDFLQKIDSVFRMFVFTTPIYFSIMAYVLKTKLNIKCYNFFNLYICLVIGCMVIYLYFLCRVIFIQSFQEGYTTVQNELPFKKSSSRESFLKNYIFNNAQNLKINREILLRLQRKVKYIHLQYILSSLFLLITLFILYLN